MLNVYTDGSCLKNPGGKGGWAFCVVNGNNKYTCVSGSTLSSTNNRMELQAVIEALHFISAKEICIHSDSMLTINCATGKWRRKANLDLWKEFDKYIIFHNVKWQWVKAHNGNKYNEIVDTLARDTAKSQ